MGCKFSAVRLTPLSWDPTTISVIIFLLFQTIMFPSCDWRQANIETWEYKKKSGKEVIQLFISKTSPT